MSQVIQVPRRFPTTPGAFQTTYRGYYDAFVNKLNPAGSALVYSTYLSGSDSTGGGGGARFAIAIDSATNAYVTGATTASDFPTTPGAFQTTYENICVNVAPCFAAFVTKLNPTGSALVYSTYLGGNDYGSGIAIDPSGSIYVTGRVWSTSFPTTPDAFQVDLRSPDGNAFVSKLNPDGSELVYSTYLGGSTGFDDQDGAGIAIDTAGNAYVTGDTYSSDFPTTQGAFQTGFGGVADAFVTKIAFETARSLKESVLSQLEQLLSSSPKGEERKKLREAIKDLFDSLAPALWASEGNHLNVPWGQEVFEKEESAVRELSELIHDKKSTISADVLQGYISSLVKADRILASTAISDAAGVDPNEIARANARLAEGDEDATAGRAGEAISDYKEAWLIISLCLDKKEK